MITGTSR